MRQDMWKDEGEGEQMHKRVLIIAVASLSVCIAAGVLTMRVTAQINSPEYQMALGLRYLDGMEYDKALIAFHKVIKVDPKNVNAYEEISDIHLSLEQLDEAADSLREGFEQTGEKAFARKMLDIGERYQESGDHERAENIWNQTLGMDAGLAEPYLLKAQACMDNGDIEGAIATLQTGLTQTQDTSLQERLQELLQQRCDSWIADGKKALAAGNLTEAQALFEQALQERPENAQLYLLQASAIEAQQPEAAVELLKKGLAATQDGQIQSRLQELVVGQNLENARRLLMENSMEEAIAFLEEVFQIDPDNAQAFQMLTDKYIELGEKGQAIEVLQRWLEVSEDEQVQAQLEMLQEEERQRIAWEKEQAKRAVFNSAALHPSSGSSAAVNNALQKIFQNILTDGMDTYDKLQACFNFIKQYMNHGRPGYLDTRVGTINAASASEAWILFGLRDFKGTCTEYSAMFYYMAKRIGVSARLVGGTTPAAGGGNTGHYWVEVTFGNQVYVFDPYLDVNFSSRGIAASNAFFGTTYAEMPGRFNRQKVVR